MLERTEDLISIVVSLAVLWVILGPLSNDERSERGGYRSAPGAAARRRHRPGRS